MGYIIYDNVNIAAHGIVADGASAYNAPERDVEMLVVPGRNGDVPIDNGRYSNTEVRYQCGITKNFYETALWARGYFLSRSTDYYRLSDSYDTSHFRLARYKSGVEMTPAFLGMSGQFDLIFDCKPQRFLISGEIEEAKSSGDTIINPTLFNAKPRIRISSATNGSVLTINGKTIRFVTAVGNATIDCDSMDCYNGAINLNSAIQCIDFPELTPGSNTISWTGTIIGFRITPRWWEL